MSLHYIQNAEEQELLLEIAKIASDDWKIDRLRPNEADFTEWKGYQNGGSGQKMEITKG